MVLSGLKKLDCLFVREASNLPVMVTRSCTEPDSNVSAEQLLVHGVL